VDATEYQRYRNMTNKRIKWHVEKRRVIDLKEWPKNPRKITDKGLADLVISIDKFGLAEPIIINTDNTICGGHGRKLALTKLGIKEIDCYVPDNAMTDKQFEELNIRLNKNIAGVFDYDILANEFEVDELVHWGFAPVDFGIPKVDMDIKPAEKTVKTHTCSACGNEDDL